MKSTTRERLAACATTLRYRVFTDAERCLLAREFLRQRAEVSRKYSYLNDEDFWLGPGKNEMPELTPEIEAGLHMVLKQDKLALARIRVCTKGTEKGTQKAEWRDAEPEDFAPFRSGGIVPPATAYDKLADEYKTVSYSPARPAFNWPSWLPYTLLGALGFALGYTILHRYV